MAAVRPTSEPSVKIFIGPSRSQSSPNPVRSPRSIPVSMPSAGCAPREWKASLTTISSTRTCSRPWSRAAT